SAAIRAFRRYARLSLPASVFGDDPAPERAALGGERLLSNAGIPRRSGDHHHELKFGIDEDRLTVDAEQRKTSLLTRKKPELIAVAEKRRRLARGKRRGLAAPVGRFEQILFRNDLLAADGAVVGQQYSKT